MKITVNVTEENIAKGKECSGGKCPVALALLDAGFISVRVSDGTSLEASKYKSAAAFYNASVNLASYISDTQAQRITKFVENFDELYGETKKKAKPFKFTMNVPDDVLKAVKFQKPEVAA